MLYTHCNTHTATHALQHTHCNTHNTHTATHTDLHYLVTATDSRYLVAAIRAKTTLQHTHCNTHTATHTLQHTLQQTRAIQWPQSVQYPHCNTRTATHTLQHTLQQTRAIFVAAIQRCFGLRRCNSSGENNELSPKGDQRVTKGTKKKKMEHIFFSTRVAAPQFKTTLDCGCHQRVTTSPKGDLCCLVTNTRTPSHQ